MGPAGAKKHNFVSSFVNICSSLNRPLTYAAVNERKDTLLVGCIMSEIVGSFRAGLALRLALAGVAAGLLAGCSNSDRLTDPFSNPFQSSSRFDAQVNEPTIDSR